MKIPTEDEVKVMEEGSGAPMDLSPGLAGSTDDSIPPMPKLSELLEKHAVKLKELTAKLDADALEVLKGEDVELICLRYLVGQQADVEKAWKKLSEDLVWRKEWKANTYDGSAWPKRTYKHVETVNKCVGLVRNVYKTKEGRLFSVFLIGRMKIDQVLSTVPIEDYKELVAEESVIDMRAFNKLSRQDDVLMSNIQVVDLKGISLSTLKFLSYFKYDTQYLELNAPECSGMILVVNAPSWFSMIWKLVKPTLDASTISKVRVFGSDGSGSEFIRSRLGDELCPQMYGGRSWSTGDAWLAENDPPYETVVISAGTSKEVSVEVDSTVQSVLWKAKAKGRDVNISVKYIISSEDKEIASGKKTSELLEGDFKPSAPGKLVITFDNSYSYIYSKTCMYYFGLVR